jgi:tellurite resistance protein TerC
MDFTFLAVIVQLIFLECILSLDNAAVMGAMVSRLPTTQGIPWPAWLAPLGRRTDRFWGDQRSAALKIGLFGAYAGRVLMLFLAGLIMQVVWVQVLGALYLIYLCINHFAEVAAGLANDDENPRSVAATGFWSVVLALNLADMAFSLDNVVAAVALSDLMWVVVIGVGIGIVVVRFAATIFTQLIEWEPALEHIAYLLILAIGTELLLDVTMHIHTNDWLRFAISLSLIVLGILLVRVRFLRPLQHVIRPLLWIAVLLDKLIQGSLALLMFPMRLAFRQ